MKIRMEAVNCQVHAASTSHHDGQKYDPHNPMNHKDISPHSAGRHLFREQILHGVGDDGRRHRRSKKNDEENDDENDFNYDLEQG